MYKETKIGRIYIAILNVKSLSYCRHFVGNISRTQADGQCGEL